MYSCIVSSAQIIRIVSVIFILYYITYALHRPSAVDPTINLFFADHLKIYYHYPIIPCLRGSLIRPRGIDFRFVFSLFHTLSISSVIPLLSFYHSLLFSLSSHHTSVTTLPPFLILYRICT